MRIAVTLATLGATLAITAVAAPKPATRNSVATNTAPTAVSPASTSEPLSAALSPQAWAQVEKSVDRALKWLSTQQSRDGSFEAPENAQPAATALSIMAFLSRGHIAGEGPYGRHLDRGIDFVLQCQRSDGLLAAAGADSGSNGKTANYNHAIAGLMLTEVYGMTDRARAAKLKPAIERAVLFTRRNQTLPKQNPGAEGGWRYLYSDRLGDSDLSVTAWQLMFLRSAKNAEFDIPKQFIDEAIGYVLSCWDDRQGLFYYQRSGDQVRWSRGMVGAGTLSLAMAGQHGTVVARRAGDWLLGHPFRGFGDTVGSGDRFFYSTYYCSQAMAQLGGRHWKFFFPTLVNTLLQGQESSGEWPPEPYGSDSMFGNTYTTAMAVLSLTPPLQLLPVYQR
ncbi:MAG: terpene cyclase/mutase family protein [Verrucomicrobiales bacterium]|nr:terpene cyclase/mutase family protein [Verrucomicrobiales bacterium]